MEELRVSTAPALQTRWQSKCPSERRDPFLTDQSSSWISWSAGSYVDPDPGLPQVDPERLDGPG